MYPVSKIAGQLQADRQGHAAGPDPQARPTPLLRQPRLVEAIWNLRTYVDGFYGNVKNADTENLHCGQFRLVGTALVHIIASLNFASYNLRTLRNWYDAALELDENKRPAAALREDIINHPLLEADPDATLHFMYLTEEQIARIMNEGLDEEAA